MNKTELVKAVAREADVSRQTAQRVVDATVKSVTRALQKEEVVTLTGFGSFQVRNRDARVGRNPRTGELVDIKASKTPVFKAGKVLKESVN